MEHIALQFALDGNPSSCRIFGEGHVNRTYRIVTDRGRTYILQRISRVAFHDIPALMENIFRVTDTLSQQSSDPRSCLHLVQTHKGEYWFCDGDGECWRVFDFVEDSVCLQKAETPAVFAECASAFGRFQRMLADFPIDSLHETIPDFHNTPVRYRKFHRVLNEDPLGRASSVQREIEFLLAREEAGAALQNMRDSGALPVRVTHNDTKLNNVLLDASTGKALCVIDLDTVMPGLVAYDFGDAIRFGASTGAEDEKDLDRIEMDLKLYEAFSEGFIPACDGLTEAEIESLPLGAKIMTLENGLRFLTDYLEGDVYFSIARPEHNLDRARTQIRLVEDMEKKWDAMQAVVNNYIP